MKIEIKNRFSGEIIFSVEAENWRFAVEAAIKSKANLSKADLSWANLSEADLSKADLSPIKNDFWAVLSAAPKEVEGLRTAIVEGRIDGSTYEGECACLVGTIANVAGKNYEKLPVLKPNKGRPAERFFLGIRKGDKPETNPASKLALDWLDEWFGLMQEAFAVKP